LIAVSGATGFLGAHVVCKLLQQQRTVKALKRAGSSMDEFNYICSLYFPKPPDQLTWAIADVLDVPALEEALDGVDEVYHCAAMVSFRQKDKETMMKTNIEGTANVVNVCLEKRIKKLAYISSIAALGREKSGTEITENTKWANSKHNSNYAISKHKAEMEVWRGVEEGLHAAIVNPGVILGSGTWTKGSCALFNMVYKGMPFYTNGINGYVDVQDVAGAAMFLMDNNRFGQRYILVSENMNMKHFLDNTATLLHRKKPFIEVNRFLAEASWISTGLVSFITGKKPAITRETARASLNKFYYNSDKIKQLGFEFKPLKQTMEEACANFTRQKQI
jgi:dihydroflavonol-4-reductase